jgi:histidine triad (HIT) family protein
MTIESDPNCIFCKIAAGEVACEKLYEDDEILSFKDTSPRAPFHGLIIPKNHIATLNDLEESQTEMMGRFLVVARDLAASHELAGYRVVINTNAEGGQVVFHIHMHVLGGRQMHGSLG